MRFVDAVAVLRRHKLLVVYGLLAALVVATFSACRLEGSRLVSRSAPRFQTTAVVAVKPGGEQPPSTTVPPTVATPTGSDPATAVPPTAATVPSPPLAPLDDVVDSRGMYYTALSLQTVVVSPGFSEAVRARAPSMDGSVTAVVAQDTNTIIVTVDGSSPKAASATMSAALAELREVVTAYAATPSSRFLIDGVVVSAPSTPQAASSVKGPLTFVLVLMVAIVTLWFLIRGLDALQSHRRDRRPELDELPSATAMPPPRPETARNGHRGASADPVEAR